MRTAFDAGDLVRGRRSVCFGSSSWLQAAVGVGQFISYTAARIANTLLLPQVRTLLATRTASEHPSWNRVVLIKLYCSRPQEITTFRSTMTAYPIYDDRSASIPAGRYRAHRSEWTFRTSMPTCDIECHVA